MSPSEKRHFRLQCRSDMAHTLPLYLRLFDLLANRAKTVYQESEIKAHFQGEACLKQFTRLKNYLYNRVVRSLRIFHAGKSIRRRCLDHLDSAELLLDRELVQQAEQQVSRAKKLAQEYEVTDLLPAVLAWERRLVKRKEHKEQDQLLAHLEKEEQKAAQSWQQEQSLFALYDRFWLLNKRRRDRAGVDLQAVDQLAQHPFLQKPVAELTFSGQLARCLSMAVYHRLKGERKISLQHYRAALDLWESRPDMVRAFGQRYLRAVTAYLYSCHAVADYQAFPTLLERIRANQNLSRADQARIATMSYNLQLLYGLNQLPLSSSSTLVKRLETELASGLVPRSAWVPGTTNVAIYYLLKEDFKSARHWISQLLNLPRGPEWADAREFARLLWLVVLYESGEYKWLGYACRSMVRYIQHRRSLSPLEKEARSFFRSVHQNPDFVHRLERLRHFRKQIQEIPSEASMGADVLQIWTEARVRNLSLDQVRSKNRTLL